MPSIPKTPGETIASNLHAFQIISGRDTERVAKQIDDAHRPLATALEKVEEFLTKIRDTNTKAGHAPTGEFHEQLREVRLTLHAHHTGKPREELAEQLKPFGV